MKNSRTILSGLAIVLHGALSSCGQSMPCDINLREVATGSQLECLQGVYQIQNDDNTDTENYQISDGYKLLAVYLRIEENKVSLIELNTGFQGFISGGTVENICNLASDGTTYVNVPAKRVKANGVVASFYKNTEFHCEEGSAEYFTNQIMVMSKLPFLPYRAYNEIIQESLRTGRDLSAEFNLKLKIRRAVIRVNRAYFHSQPEESSRSLAFLIDSDVVIVDRIEKNWIKVAFEGPKGITEGWLRINDLEIMGN